MSCHAPGAPVGLAADGIEHPFRVRPGEATEGHESSDSRKVVAECAELIVEHDGPFKSRERQDIGKDLVFCFVNHPCKSDMGGFASPNTCGSWSEKAAFFSLSFPVPAVPASKQKKMIRADDALHNASNPPTVRCFKQS